MTYRLVTDGLAVAEMVSGAGPAGQFLIKQATLFQTAARAGAPKKSGCLAASIVKRPVVEEGGMLSIMIEADTTSCSPSRTNYAEMVHNGTKAHDIFAKNASNLLVFKMGDATIFVNTSKTPVHHPGTKPHPFFTEAEGVLKI